MIVVVGWMMVPLGERARPERPAVGPGAGQPWRWAALAGTVAAATIVTAMAATAVNGRNTAIIGLLARPDLPSGNSAAPWLNPRFPATAARHSHDDAPLHGLSFMPRRHCVCRCSPVEASAPVWPGPGSRTGGANSLES